MRPMSIEWRLKNLLKCQKCTAVQEAAIANVIFTQDDMLLGDMKQNQPLYLSGYIADVKVQRIQVDMGSAVNVMPFCTLAYLGIPPRKSTPRL